MIENIVKGGKDPFVVVRLPIPRPWFNIIQEDAKLRGRTVQEILRNYISHCGIVRKRALKMQLLDYDFRMDLVHPDFDIPEFECFFPRNKQSEKKPTKETFPGGITNERN